MTDHLILLWDSACCRSCLLQVVLIFFASSLFLLSLAKPFPAQKHTQNFLIETQLLMAAQPPGVVHTQLTPSRQAWQKVHLTWDKQAAVFHTHTPRSRFPLVWGAGYQLASAHVTTLLLHPNTRQERELMLQLGRRRAVLPLQQTRISPALSASTLLHWFVPVRAGHCLHYQKNTSDKLFTKKFAACIVLNNIHFSLTNASIVYASVFVHLKHKINQILAENQTPH